MEIIFNRQVRCVTKGVFRTVSTRSTTAWWSTPSAGHSRIKTYLKDGRTQRAGTVINDLTSASCAAWSTSAS